MRSPRCCSHPPSADQLFLPRLLESASLLPQTTPEPQVTGECGWLLGRAVSMETKVPVGEQKAARVQVLVPPLQIVCLRPLEAQPSLPHSGSILAIPRLCSCPHLPYPSGLSANPVGSAFKRYSKSNHFSQPPLSLLRSKPRSPLIWMTAGASELVILLPPFSLNLLLCSKPSGVLRFSQYESHISYNILHVLVTWPCTISASSPATLPSCAPLRHTLQPSWGLQQPGLLPTQGPCDSQPGLFPLPL